VRKALLDGPESLRRPACRLRREGVEILRRVEPARVRRERGSELAAEQLVDGDAQLLPEQVPQRNVDRAHSVQDDAAATDVERSPVHRLPDVRHLGRSTADH
jgi:hypothetical protein